MSKFPHAKFEVNWRPFELNPDAPKTGVIYVYVYIYVCIYDYIYIYTPVYIYYQGYTYLYWATHTHTHTHTHTNDVPKTGAFTEIETEQGERKREIREMGRVHVHASIMYFFYLLY